ncbi:MAG: outer membrane protein transport protein [Kiritimatiellaceae bacterium]|nr:outer membrane protein transport protein [Kiritimatiellaceae bacterium]
MNKKKIIFSILISIAAISAQATEGINLIGVGPVQQGTAGAGVASAKDSTWLILNPAGLTDTKLGLDTSIQYFAPRRTINSTLSGGAGKQKDTSAFFIPSISATLGCCNDGKGFFGFGIYGTSGMGVDYSKGRIGADTNSDMMPDTPQGQVDTMTELAIAKMTFTYAHKFDNGFSIGAGPIFVLSRLKTDMISSINVPQSGDWDEAVGLGAIIGVNQKITDRLTIGASYMSEQYMTEFDEYDDLLDDSMNLPQQVTIGLAYNILTNLEAVLDYRWVGWSHLDTLGDQFGWEDQNIVKAGLTWGATDHLTLRGGISHGNSPIDSSSAFGNALFPAIMETHLSCGASYQFENFALHFAFTHALEEDITANGKDAGPMGPLARGTEISMSQNSATIGVSWKF